MAHKIAMIGAGSIVFCKTLMSDIMATPALAGSEFALMSRTEPKLRAMEAFGQRMLRDNGLPGSVWATLDRAEAIRDADFVVVMVQVGGVEAFGLDYKIPLKYGVDQCIADSLGPGGIFRGMRTIPLLVDIAKDMERLAKPGAILLQYANPMAANCLALGKASKVSFVGLCHGVQTTLDLISRYCDVPKDEITYTCGGINHMDWFLRLEHKGEDLYPDLRAVFERPEFYKNEKVRGEVFRHFGYFMTESTGHLSEYVPWFRKNAKAMELYCDEPSFGGESGAYYSWCKAIADIYAEHDPLETESTKISHRSVEYCSYIMEAVATGKPFRFMGNVRNDGYITNLPRGCCVEVPTFADDTGLRPTVVGDLPPQCAALCMTNVNVQLLAAEAALNADPERLVQAVAMDPLTSAVCTLGEIREMCTEMLEAQREWLPGFHGRYIKQKPVISIPADCEPVDVPLDPALAIGKRFSTLLERS
ncbi:alpha-galactosidase [Paludibaculum fermentans]|uniref:Alpha-galactosidase n=1 Tax=Paludibaculum fermentans TaxID=1473598 RepID=A0A7S7SL18_PALFE|nr:alpha-galactosidase [Paludibaculum fermentans]QOY87981.1 alpha-galactosidase [Paludibaculum fermentans]